MRVWAVDHRVKPPSWSATNVQTSPWHSRYTAICSLGLANHKRTTSTKAANIHMKQPLQCDLHTCILLYSGGRVRDQIREDRTRRTDEVPPIDAGATLHEKTQALVRFLTSKHHLDAAIQRRSAIIAALQIKKSSTSFKATNLHMKQPLQCDLHTWIILYSGGRVRDQIREGRTRRFPPSTPGATLHEKTWGFVRFLTSKLPNITLTLQVHCDLRSSAFKSQKN